MKLKGRESYDVKFICSDLFVKPERYGDIFLASWKVPKYKNASCVIGRPVFKDLEETCTASVLKLDPVFAAKQQPFVSGMSLYFDSACDIPRAAGEKLWKRVVKLDKADLVVIPVPKGIKYSQCCAMFINYRVGNIYIAEDAYNLGGDLSLGHSLEHFVNKSFDTAFLNSHSDSMTFFGDAVCEYIGPMVFYPDCDEFIFKVLDGTYDKIIFEDDLMTAIGESGEKFSKESIESLVNMLSSHDEDSVHLGMRTLAAMDYMHHPACALYILNKTHYNWENHSPFNSAVKFMLNSLNYSYATHVFEHVTPEEFDIIKDYYTEHVKECIGRSMNNFKNHTDMQIDYTFTVSLKPNSDEQNNI